jgi:hypothetical protein
LNYVRLVCERDILTTDYFTILGFGIPASIELICRAKETTFTEAVTGALSGVVNLVPVISPPKHTALLLYPFF